MKPAIHVIHPEQRSGATPQTRGMLREAGVAPETTGNENLWMGMVASPAGMVSGWHHHGDCETGIYVLQGRVRFRSGKGGADVIEAGPGDFLSVASNAIHREESVGDEDLIVVIARACSEVTVINVDGPEPE